MNDLSISRRDMILAAGAAAVGVLGWETSAAGTPAQPVQKPRNRSLRIAHLTDIHVQPERRAAVGLASCLQHVQQAEDKPELIITGGDSVMDSFAADDARTQQQWDLWNSTWRNECSLPVRSCIGNHDIWGWAKAKSRTTGQEPHWGKRRAVENLHLENRFYTFTQAGWRLIILDSVQPLSDGQEGYAAYLDDEQFDWLAGVLRDDGQSPVLIVSHIPILSATALQHEPDADGKTEFGPGLIHTDRVKLKNLFAQHRNVKACLSGHTHLLDRVDYNGVSYLCNGAVCGGWWQGRHADCDEGYAFVDLYDDGTLERQYVNYGWQATAA